MIKRLHLKNRGDTIIEVMIVLAVLGLAISISYTTANRSLLAARQAQENAKATQILHSQIEELRYLAPAETTAGGPKDIFRPGPFCIKKVAADDYAVVTAPPAASPDPACYEVDSLYDITITYQNSPPDFPDTFTLSVSWTDVTGQGQNSVQMNYRVHKPTPPPAGGPAGGGAALPQCSDGIDNDSDGRIDFGIGLGYDPDCLSAVDDSEATPAPLPLIVIEAAGGSGDFPAWHLAHVGGTKQTKVFTIRNPAGSPAPLNISAVPAFMSGANPTDFGIQNENCGGRTLQPGVGSCTITVEFAPDTGPAVNRYSSTGPRTATLNINSDAVIPGTYALSSWTVTDRLAPGESLTASFDGRLVIRGHNNSCYNDAFNCNSILILFPGLLARYPNQYINNATWFRVLPGAIVATMQPDGNFVVYNAANAPLWASSWEGSPMIADSWLKIYDGGALRMMNPSWNSNPDNGALWSSPGW